ncbi:hypothetical protein O5D80_008620 [Batrachochytrium dendrobatidis]|nr:hypothetical protein O5D80_008620 [Batrachochytrium dendrobatidis]
MKIFIEGSRDGNIYRNSYRLELLAGLRFALPASNLHSVSGSVAAGLGLANRSQMSGLARFGLAVVYAGGLQQLQI